MLTLAGREEMPVPVLADRKRYPNLRRGFLEAAMVMVGGAHVAAALQ